MTMQEYFDKRVAHLRALKGRAFDPTEGSCSYLTPDGRKCAIGVHIPDGHPAQRFVGGVDDLLVNWPDLEGTVTPDHWDGLALAKELQNTHDGKNGWDGDRFVSESRLHDVARYFNLKYTPGAE